MDKIRKTHSTEFKAKSVLEVLRGERTLNEIASDKEIHPNVLARWKKEAVEKFELLFEADMGSYLSNKKQLKEKDVELEELYKQIGKLTTQVEWLKKKSGIRI